MTIWKQIQQYPGYEISNEGQVRNMKTGRILKGHDAHGYQFVRLMHQNGNLNQVKVHQLVAQYFVDGYEQGLEVDHINRDTYDNRAENLRWVTRSQNLRNTCRNRKVVNETLGIDFGSLAEAAEWLVAQSLSKNYHSATCTLWMHLNGQTKSCGKCVWRYDNEQLDD